MKFKKIKDVGWCVFTNKGAMSVTETGKPKLMGNPKDGVAIFKNRTDVQAITQSINKEKLKIFWMMTGKASVVERCD